MPNGKYNDHPITDMLNYGEHPFPPDMEEMIRRIYEINPSAGNELGMEPFEWEKGFKLDDGRERLKTLLNRLEASKEGAY
ncbi:MAG: hypothetical protein IID51_04290 [Proteobacteria bacterium]|nr:hypothetical protein [Pseudomonadota bacterium]